ncbi:hypothetical protein [Roseibium aggregatum]|uniref:Cytochrome c domain-containing protein n=1 Tax=Roseibium aggregatum TaxID=187304 RepID=A0A939EKK1_9HYPH|nr:hypothetical protein [Roseibium aggregatum]MBN9673375.1 hypothetical protein [Roseibium aggregatum]
MKTSAMVSLDDRKRRSKQNRSERRSERRKGPRFCLSLVAAFCLSANTLEAAPADPRQTFDSDCGACHGQGAIQLLRNSVEKTDAGLVMRDTGVALEIFLKSHFRHRNDNLIAVILEFVAQNRPDGP